jgi:hypothetical protein
MPTADATLLPPVEAPEDRASSRTLEDVGTLNVLTAMRRPSMPPACEVEPIERDATDEEVAGAERAPRHSDAFIKTR